MPDLGPLDLLEAESFGEPGLRTFRLRLQSSAGSVSVWIEKEQVVALGLALHEVFSRVLGHEPPSATLGALSSDFAATPDIDFKAAQLGIGYDGEDESVILFAYDHDPEEDETPTVACRASMNQAATLVAMLDAIVEAGRPVCPLCGEPMGPSGHVCPRSNGHHNLAQR